jgi:hypothetical protein
MRHRWGLGVLVLLGACSNRAEEKIGRSASPIVSALPAMNFARANAGCASFGGGQVLWAGSDIPGGYLSTAEIFDPVTKKWTETTMLSNFRGNQRSIALDDGRVIIQGGYGDAPEGGNTPSTTTEAYDPAKRTWTKLAPSKIARARHLLTRMIDGRILATGGFVEYEHTPSSDAEIYDPKKDSWSPAPSMNERRVSHAGIVLPDGSIFVAGNQATGVAEVLSSDGTKWTPTAPMKIARQAPAVALLADGRVIVAGGTDGSTSPLSTTEIWSKDTNAFVDGPPMKAVHSNPVAVPLANGAIIVTGGNEPLVERLDPKGTAWTDVGTLMTPRIDGCIVPIPGGALFAGGVYVGPTYTVEAYFGADAAASCSVDDECASGKCSGGKCTAPPALDAGVPDASPAADTGAGGTPKVEGSFEHCSKDSECATGHCADGVCCDTACNDTCHSCVLPGSAGKCTVEPIGVDLRGECGIALSCTGTCGGDGKCIGAGAGSQCAPSKCTSASTGVGPAVCTARGAHCPTSEITPFDCAPYACEPIFGACRTSCAASSECAGGNVCDVSSKTCVTPTATAGEESGGCSYGSSASTTSPLWLLLALVSLRRSSRAL